MGARNQVVWTRKAPTVGWWWMREVVGGYSGRPPYVSPPQVVEVLALTTYMGRARACIDNHDSEGGRSEVYIWDDSPGHYIDRKTEWAGPLPMPVEPKEPA